MLKRQCPCLRSEMQRDLTDINEMAAEIRRTGHALPAVPVTPVKQPTEPSARN